MRVWDAACGQETLILKGKASVAFSPDGKWLASGDNNGMVKIWDLASGRELLTCMGHTSPVTCVAFSPDGKQLASGSLDPKKGAKPDELRIWDATTGQEMLTLKDTDSVTSLAFSPDGLRLASADSDGKVRIWDARPLTDELRLEREAVSLYQFVLKRLALKLEMIKHIRQDATVSEPVRGQALAWAERYREDPRHLNQASWAVGPGSGASPAAYHLALRQAEAACRIEPNKGEYLTTLGVAQYRVGKYQEAVATLTQADKVNGEEYQESLPHDLKFLAMAQHQLGQKEKAKATLDRLRETMKKPEWAKEPWAQVFLREAEEVIDIKKP